jgi:hypothetical protein
MRDDQAINTGPHPPESSLGWAILSAGTPARSRRRYSEWPRNGRCVFGGARPSAPTNTSSVLQDGRSLSTISLEPGASVNVWRLCCRADRAPGAATTVFSLGFRRLRRARGPRPGQYQPLVGWPGVFHVVSKAWGGACDAASPLLLPVDAQW